MAEGSRLSRKDQKPSGRFLNFRLFDRSGTSKEEAPGATTTRGTDRKMDEAGVRSSDDRLDEANSSLDWITIHPKGKGPEPRFYHAAAVVGRKMLVVGGDTGRRKLNDVQLLHLGKLTWTELGPGSATDTGGLYTKPGSIQQLPPCKGHSLVPWGKNVLLIAGEMNPPNDRVEVWSFDIEAESWSKVATKGEIPVARSGQSVTRAGSILVLFGGEDAKGRKLNDLHILDMKQLMWLPLQTTGTAPAPRARHTAAMYQDRFLLIFGGASKHKNLNDTFSLDLESMEWSRLKTKGLTPGPRAGHASALLGDKWYITGGDNSGQVQTLLLDLLQTTWSLITASKVDSVVANQGLSLQTVQRKDRTFLVAFGGRGPEISSEVQVLFIPPSGNSVIRTPPRMLEQTSTGSTPENARSRNHSPSFAPLPASGIPCACVSVAEPSVVQAFEQGRASPGEETTSSSTVADSALTPLRKRFAQVQHSLADAADSVSTLQSELIRERSASEYTSREVFLSEESFGSGESPSPSHESPSKGESSGDQGSWRNSSKPTSSPSKLPQALWPRVTGEINDNVPAQQRSPEISAALAGILGTGWSSKHAFEQQGSVKVNEDLEVDVDEDLRHPDAERREDAIRKLKQSYERKLAAALQKNAITEGQFAVVSKGREEVEKGLKRALRAKEKAEDRLAAALKEQQELQISVKQAERAQEESNSLANIVHQENLRLEHDVAFLKAMLEETQKELQTTRGVLEGERSRAFQLQVEVFELKQRLQALESSSVWTGS